MKKMIDKDQFRNLSDRGKEYLSNWCEEKGYGAEIDGVFVSTPQLDIGQLIEFLLENDIAIDTFSIDEDICDDLWESVKEILERVN